MGYNKLDKRYEMVWMDNHSTAIAWETGTYDEAKKILNMRGTYRDPVTGRLVPTRSRMELSSADRQVGSSWSEDIDGAEFKMFEGVLERVKK